MLLINPIINILYNFIEELNMFFQHLCLKFYNLKIIDLMHNFIKVIYIFYTSISDIICVHITLSLSWIKVHNVLALDGSPIWLASIRLSPLLINVAASGAILLTSCSIDYKKNLNKIIKKNYVFWKYLKTFIWIRFCI